MQEFKEVNFIFHYPLVDLLILITRVSLGAMGYNYYVLLFL